MCGMAYVVLIGIHVWVEVLVSYTRPGPDRPVCDDQRVCSNTSCFVYKNRTGHLILSL